MPIQINELPIEIKEELGVIKNIQYPKQGCTSDVAVIETDATTYVVKRAKGEQYCSWLSKESSVLNALKNCSLPIPNVFNFVEQKEESQSWILMDFLEGETVRSALLNEKNREKRQDIVYQFGKVLSQIHSTPCPKEFYPSSTWLEEMLKTAEYNLKHYEVDGTRELLDTIKTNKPRPVKQTLIHGDFTVDNVLMNNGKISGIIDWSGGAFGDPRYDASLAIRRKKDVFEEEDVAIFFEGYRSKIINNEERQYFDNGLYEFF
ncbi:phosphotransferase family protein [Gottfriedia endophytica]|uniref:phosphotransferase family protein n=1 Tax=Gottfriedia endophytica TaxID=2820819 RepID=UPI001FD864E8|nr:aminoglycoside phosphotransferase family protein [Gottfriedia endophytica]